MPLKLHLRRPRLLPLLKRRRKCRQKWQLRPPRPPPGLSLQGRQLMLRRGPSPQPRCCWMRPGPLNCPVMRKKCEFKRNWIICLVSSHGHYSLVCVWLVQKLYGSKNSSNEFLCHKNHHSHPYFKFKKSFEKIWKLPKIFLILLTESQFFWTFLTLY